VRQEKEISPMKSRAADQSAINELGTAPVPHGRRALQQGSHVRLRNQMPSKVELLPLSTPIFCEFQFDENEKPLGKLPIVFQIKQLKHAEEQDSRSSTSMIDIQVFVSMNQKCPLSNNLIEGGLISRREGKYKTTLTVLSDHEYGVKGINTRAPVTFGPYGSGHEQHRYS
jgi:hypothetical protein